MVGTKNEFVVLSLGRAATALREVSNESRGGSARPAWHLADGTRGIGSVLDEKCRLYRETGRAARSFEDSAWLISADQPRDKFMLRPEIYIRGAVHAGARMPKKARGCYSGYSAFPPANDSTYVRGRFCRARDCTPTVSLIESDRGSISFH